MVRDAALPALMGVGALAKACGQSLKAGKRQKMIFFLVPPKKEHNPANTLNFAH